MTTINPEEERYLAGLHAALHSRHFQPDFLTDDDDFIEGWLAGCQQIADEEAMYREAAADARRDDRGMLR